MTIFTSLYAIPNHDRIESWRGAFRYLKQAEPLFQVRPKIHINLRLNRAGACAAWKGLGVTWSRRHAPCGPVLRGVGGERRLRRKAPNSRISARPQAPAPIDSLATPRTITAVIGNVIGGIVWFAVAFAFVALLGLWAGAI